jgi:hypothetical protein
MRVHHPHDRDYAPGRHRPASTNVKGNFDAAEYERQIKYGVDG